jgi:hypothetical protein
MSFVITRILAQRFDRWNRQRSDEPRCGEPLPRVDKRVSA